MNERDNEELAAGWAKWLQNELNQREWRQVDLVNHSAGQIKRDRASKWLSGKERPSYRNAIIVANTLGTDQATALQSAGYRSPEAIEEVREKNLLAAIADIEKQLPTMVVRRTVREFSDSDLLEELLRRAHEREGFHGNVVALVETEKEDLPYAAHEAGDIEVEQEGEPD